MAGRNLRTTGNSRPLCAKLSNTGRDATRGKKNYQKTLSQRIVLNTSIRVLIYDGDVDPSINSFATQNWTSSLGFNVKNEWRPWTIDGKQYMGGYVTEYDNDFTFLTIRGSGHMVPQFKPRVTFEFLKTWLQNKEFPDYQSPTEL